MWKIFILHVFLCSRCTDSTEHSNITSEIKSAHKKSDSTVDSLKFITGKYGSDKKSDEMFAARKLFKLHT